MSAFYSPLDRHELRSWLEQRNGKPLRISNSAPTLLPDDRDVISLQEINTITLYEPEETIITCEAGLSLRALNEALRNHNQWIPTLVAEERSETTVGGALANGKYHPRERFGSPLRTTVLGGTFCTTSGILFRSGSRVVKSVAGYDIHRAFVGSKGKFGVIVEVTLKVVPLPEMFYRFLVPIAQQEILVSLHPTIMEQIGDQLLIEIAGYQEDITGEKESLLSAGIGIQEITQTQWLSIINSFTKEHTSQATFDHPLLQGLRRVFDEEGVLV